MRQNYNCPDAGSLTLVITRAELHQGTECDREQVKNKKPPLRGGFF